MFREPSHSIALMSRRFVLESGLLFAILVIGSGCNRPPEKETSSDPNPKSSVAAVPRSTELKHVSYGVSPFQDTLLPIIAKELNWYTEAGLDVDIRVLGWTEVQEAVASGAVDVGVNNISSVVASHQNAPNLVYAYGLNTFDNGFALMVRPNGKLKTLAEIEREVGDHKRAVRAAAEQLEGATVVTTSGTDMEQGVAAAARRGGVRFADVRIVDLPPDEGLAAFLSGTGDAYIGGVPQRTRAAKEGMVEMLTGIDIGPPPINGLVTTKAYFNGNMSTLVTLVNLWFKTVRYIERRDGPPGKTGAEIILRSLNQNSAGRFEAEDFWRFWNNYEHYPENPAAVESDILSEEGNNYWKRRFDDCNDYFFNVSKRIQKPVLAEDAFWMTRLHKEVLLTWVDGKVPKNGFGQTSQLPAPQGN
jgi:NitT/TauT family transport system substrate-binding protein